MKQTAIQDQYDEGYSHCYCCGSLNEEGLHLKSFCEGEEVVAIFKPEPYHIALPGFVYGGLIASLIDCHSIATAAAAEVKQRGGCELSRYVTGSLKVDYLHPTPLGVPLEVRGCAEEIGERKVVVTTTLSANGEVCAKGHVVAVKMPESMA